MLGLYVTGEIVDTKVSVSDWDYLGLDSQGIGNKGLTDQVGTFHFSASGKLTVIIKCTESSDCNKPERIWYLSPSVNVNNVKFGIPYTEPHFSIPGMGYVIIADKIIRAGEHISKAKDKIEFIGKALLGSPDAICRGFSAPTYQF